MWRLLPPRCAHSHVAGVGCQRDATGGAATWARWPQPIALSPCRTREVGNLGDREDSEATRKGWAVSIYSFCFKRNVFSCKFTSFNFDDGCDGLTAHDIPGSGTPVTDTRRCAQAASPRSRSTTRPHARKPPPRPLRVARLLPAPPPAWVAAPDCHRRGRARQLLLLGNLNPVLEVPPLEVAREAKTVAPRKACPGRGLTLSLRRAACW